MSDVSKELLGELLVESLIAWGLEGAVRDRTAELTRANAEIQRFAYIVSHDLRSPLVNVMGFTAELEAAAKPLAALLERAEAEAPGIVTEDARAAVRADLPESIGFIRTSTQKMDRLIAAILQLSRQGRRVACATNSNPMRQSALSWNPGKSASICAAHFIPAMRAPCGSGGGGA